MHSEQTLTLFWSKVARCPHGDSCEQCCWEWISTRGKRGYGVFDITAIADGKTTRRQQRAPRMAWQITHGDIPAELHVLHRCDNPPCVNPNHLWIGTPGDNVRDAQKKGRLATGDRNAMRLYPEKRRTGENHWTKIHPEKILRGDKAPSRLHPERVARGERHGSYLHPESVPRGEKHPSAKLTEQEVKIIRLAASQGITTYRLAKFFGLHYKSMMSIVRRKTWKHVEDDPHALDATTGIYADLLAYRVAQALTDGQV